MMQKQTIGDCTLYCGDCRDILPMLGKVDAVVTDPPYPNYNYEWEYIPIEILPIPKVHSFMFWPCNQDFPLSFTARHIWSKCNVCVGDLEPYETIFEINGGKFHGVFRNSVINCEMNAVMNGDEYHPHPTQKPIKLMKRLVKRTKGIVLDPFMGSGTTGVACVKLGRKFIGVELEEKYFDIACRRIEQAYAQPDMFIEQPTKPTQPVLL